MRGLIIVDVQNDFCPGGALPTPRGHIVAHAIAQYSVAYSHQYAAIITTQDWHIHPGEHFSATPNFHTSWPVHCQAETWGADLHPDLIPLVPSFTHQFRKGHYQAAYSGFEAVSAQDGTTSLYDWLSAHHISDLDIVGIATDYCVKATAHDALDHHFSVRIFSDLTAAVHEKTARATLDVLAQRGATIATSERR